MRKKILFLLFIVISFQGFSQNYLQVDSVVNNYPKKFRSIKDFANKIETDFDSDINRVRAIYYWISNNIEYDYKALRSKKNDYKSIGFVTEKEYQEKLLKQKNKYAERTLKSKKAVCEGYSQLLKFTCLELNIEAEVISGFAKTYISEIGRIRNDENHAWNAVKINNKWKLIDATWSTGNEENKPKRFNFSDQYFLISPNKLILNHLPKDTNWQLLKNPISKSEFFFKPIFYGSYFISKIELNTNTKGVIKVKTNEYITLRFDTVDESKTYYYAFKEDKYSSLIKMFKTKKGYSCRILYTAKRNTMLSIIDDNKTIIAFKISFQK